MRHRLVLVPHEAGYGNMGIFDLFRQIESGPGSGLQGKLTWLVVGLGNIGLEYENTRHTPALWQWNSWRRRAAATSGR